MNARSARQGFTLIELLVVITILGILAALLMPVFLKARLRSHVAVCESNLHQIDIAIRMYQEDHDGAYPESFSDNVGLPKNGLGHSYDPLYPYLHNPTVYHCPDADTPQPFLRNDYRYRVGDLLNFPESPHAVMKPEPSSAVMYDTNHGQGTDTTYLVLRVNGSVSQVSDKLVTNWQYTDGHWQVWQTFGNATYRWPVFPGELWPPQFEK